MHHDLLHRLIRRVLLAPPKRWVHRSQQRLQVLLVPNHHIGESVSAPQEQNPLGYLQVARVQTLRKPSEQCIAIGHQVFRAELTHQILQFVEKKHLFGAGPRGPIAKQPLHDLPINTRRECDESAERRVLLRVERHAVGERRAVLFVLPHFVERNERLLEGLEVFGANRNREPVDDRREDLEEHRNPVVTLCLVEKCVEGVVDSAANRGAAVCELSVDSVSGHFEVFALLRVRRIEQRNEARDERVCDVVLSNRVVDPRGENDVD